MSVVTILVLVLLLTAVLTIVPRKGAKKKCALGYRALCTFAPISTITLLVIAGTVWLIGSLA